jgi:hypothetical protein
MAKQLACTTSSGSLPGSPRFNNRVYSNYMLM